MARQNRSYLRKSSPRRRSSFSPKSGSGAPYFQGATKHYNATLVLKLSTERSFPAGYDSHRNKPPPSYNRFRKAANLSKTREESPEVDARQRDDSYRDFHSNEFVEGKQDYDNEDEDDIAEWDEESTIVAMLHDE
jgi:hypothetical protein